MSGSATPADELLRCLIGKRPLGAPDPKALEGLRARAHAHGLSALAAHRAATGGITLPDHLRRGLEEDASAARRRCAFLDLELRRAAAAVPRGAATPIVIKGPAVARRYAEPGLRPYIDIDLLVPEAELGAWRGALEPLGYAGPTDWEERAARLGHLHLVFHRPGPEGGFPLELHWRLFIERRARAVDHGALAPHCSPDQDLGGLLVASLPAQLVVLAVHLAHHVPETRKLVWLLDFAELGSAHAVERARRLAEGWNVGWALEHALAEAEAAVGEARWNARPEPLSGFAASRRSGASTLRDRVATARELGSRTGARFLLGRLDPRRFRRADGSFDWTAAREWARRNLGPKR